VKRELDNFIKKTQADELIVVSDVYEESARFESLEIIAEILKS
jgi:hypothetical protein